MNPLTCADVTAQIELYAADQCSEADSAAIGRHLASCPACAQLHREAQQLVGLLDARFQEAERLDRLRDAVAAERATRDRKARILPFFQRAAALAAMLLVVVGLFAWLNRDPHTGDGGLVATRDGANGPALGKWPRSVLGGEDGREALVRINPEPAPVIAKGTKNKDAATREVVFWASPAARWKALSSRKIDLKAGSLLVSVLQLKSKPGDKVEIQTPSATATTRGGAFFIEVKPGVVRRAQPGKPTAKADKTQTIVIVLEGQVEVTNSLGAVTGLRGDKLSATDQSPPKK